MSSSRGYGHGGLPDVVRGDDAIHPGDPVDEWLDELELVVRRCSSVAGLDAARARSPPH